MKAILILHGPNLAHLGRREPEIYGRRTLSEIDGQIRAEATRLGIEVDIRQTNHEGAIVDAILEAPGRFAGIILNPGAYAHTSLAIHDALRAAGLPAIEVHLTNVLAREPRRRELVVAEAAAGLIAGLGPEGYLAALRFLAG